MVGTLVAFSFGSIVWVGSLGQDASWRRATEAPRSDERHISTLPLSLGDLSAPRSPVKSGDRDGNPLTNPACLSIPPTNCQDRERINGPAFRLAFGHQNNSFFKRFDEFVLSANGYVKEVCLRVELLNPETCMDTIDNDIADPDCPAGCDPNLPQPNPCLATLADGNCSQIVNPIVHPIQVARFQLTIWENFVGLPEFLVAGPYRNDVDVPGAMDINTGTPIAGGLHGEWGLTGDSIGFGTTTFRETGVHLIIPTADQVQLFGDTCYWLEMDMDDGGGGCFMLLAGSPESEPGQGTGNMHSITFDATVRLTPDPALDFRSFDLHYCINAESTQGAPNTGTPVPLAEVNDDFFGCFNSFKTIPPNDTAASPTLLFCGGSEGFDNSWASVTQLFGNGACRKNVNEDVPSPRGDLYYLFQATVEDPFDPGKASARVSLCSTNTLIGESGGDAILQVFGFGGLNMADPFNPPMVITPNDVFEIGCSDDGCGLLPDICLTNLTLGAFYMVRVHSFDYRVSGRYTITLNCPCPTIQNDTCEDAEEIPGNEFTQPLGIITLGNTSYGQIESVPAGCESTLRIEAKNGPSFLGSNTAWYKLTGQGALINLNTDQLFFGEDYDTDLAIFCSDDNTCNDLACIGSNDDIDGITGLFKSDIIFCGILGRDYYIAVHGSGTQAGDFAMLVRQLRDSQDNFIECCANANQCTRQTTFSIPPHSIDEVNFPPESAEDCQEGDIDGNNNGCAGPANNLGNYNDTFAELSVGVPVNGSLFSLDGGRDNDEFLFKGYNDQGEETIIDYSVQSERPIRMRPEAAFSLYFFPCAGLAIGSWTNHLLFDNQRVNQRNHWQVNGSQDNNGLVQPLPIWEPTGAFTLRNRIPGQGTPCGERDRYWIKINGALDARDCPAVETPSGVLTTDNEQNPRMGEVTFGDVDSERIQPTFGDDNWTNLTDPTYGFSIGTEGGGACGASCLSDADQGDGSVCGGEGSIQDIFAGEPCETRKATGDLCVGAENLSGCNITPNFEGDFLLLRPNIPMVGSIDGQISSSGVNRDIDWYKFRIGDDAAIANGDQFLVTINVQSGHCMFFGILENRCANNIFDQIPYGTAATTGDCLSRTLVASDVMVLTANVYVVFGLWGDIFGNSNGSTFDNAPCSYLQNPETDPSGITKYILTVSAEPLPNCKVDLAGTSQKTAEAFEGCPLGNSINPLLEDRPSNCAGESNDGCAVGTFNSDSIASGDAVNGKLFTLFEMGNTTLNWLTDQDYYSFEVTTSSARVTYNAVADGPVRVQVGRTGPGGSLCIDDSPYGSIASGTAAGVVPRGGVRIIDAIDAALCNAVPSGCPCDGDVNQSGFIDFADIQDILSNTGCTVGTGNPVCDRSDVNCDGVVDQTDLDIVVCQFSQPAPGDRACCPIAPSDGVIHLTAGHYALIVTPGTVADGLAAEDFGCDLGNELTYTLDLMIEATGGCCVVDDCNITTQAECATPLNDMGCETGYENAGGGGAFATIGGTPLDFGPGEDPNLLVLSLGGTFTYYGVVYTNIAVSENGHIVLGGSASGNTATPRPFPSVDSPNRIVGPLFHDWDAPSTDVFFETTASSTTVEWNAVSSGNSGWSGEFQVILTHDGQGSDGQVEFRYGAFANTDPGSDSNSLQDAEDEGYVFEAGVEDHTGLRGLAVDTSTVLGGNTSVVLNPSALNCPLDCCLGNGDKLSPGQVDFADLNAVLGNWLNDYSPDTGPGDADCDGIVNFADVNEVLGNWLNVCPTPP